VWIPFVVAAALCAWFYMDSLTQAKTDTEAYKLAVGNRQTWIMSILYIGTFGSFIGYSFALPLVIKNTFPEFLAHHAFIANYLAGLSFVGALIGSLTRPLGGRLSDRVGGARVTFVSFLGMAVFTVISIAGVNGHSFTVFFLAFMVIFALAGIGNGSTYRMIPSIFAALGDQAGGEKRPLFKRQAAAVIGIAGSVGAFGGFLIQVVFRQASLSTAGLMTHATKTIHDKHLLALKKAAIAHTHQGWSVPALWAFLAAYVVLAAVTWAFYLRKAPANAKVPSLAYASI
jgi:NNP family nitrate/nitrite transporter-like MFS transporter